MDSSFRWNDGGEKGASLWVGRLRMRGAGCSGARLVPGVRRDDGVEDVASLRLDGFVRVDRDATALRQGWIPAFAGMTIRSVGRRCELPASNGLTVMVGAQTPVCF